MIPKNVRVKNPKLLKQLKKEVGCCEKCGSHFNLESAHLISKGANGPDIRENVAILCGPARYGAGCHGAEHRGKISKYELFEIVAKREGITPEECRTRVRRAMGYEV
ncbi:hypothetical protein [Sporomusa malonica]|uniref:HNH endonuclease n=1 Tax=Sporomusa malonica TaxID=112901 RepID=A0A1W2ASJ9_9FIRM|nr:hypothetical protein [Sporomusa malonica]SMC63574.1 hypothetical protein SAMN04488500_10679 [Sporomusa malonica]